MDTDAHGSVLTEALIGAAFEVSNVLGGGVLECDVYAGAADFIGTWTKDISCMCCRFGNSFSTPNANNQCTVRPQPPK